MIPQIANAISLSDFQSQTRNFDICLVRRQKHWTGKLIAWGQKHFMESFGYDKETVEQTRKWIHVFLIYNSKYGSCIESNPPKIKQFPITDYIDSEVLVLRLNESLTKDEESIGRHMFQKYNGLKYDYGEYMTYPFYMSFGQSPGFWNKMWDSENKPVCSGFALKMYNEMGKLKYLEKKTTEYPPSRLLLIPELNIVGRYKITKDDKTEKSSLKELPCWLR